MEAATPSFVPEGFEPPLSLVTARFALVPLGPHHNEADHAAWSSSIAHIRATPGFEGRSWPREMSLAENLGDLEMHARHFEQRCGFTYAVLDPRTNEVIGCVYIYPAAKPTGAGHAACVRSWTRVDRAELDEPLRLAVRAWLGQEWPFEQVVYSTHD